MTSEIIDEVFSKLVKNPNFDLSESKLYYYLNKSNFQEKIDKYEEDLNISPYTIFVKEQLDKGITLNNVLDLWSKTKKSKSGLKIYKNKYNTYLKLKEQSEPNDEEGLYNEDEFQRLMKSGVLDEISSDED